MLKSAEGSNLEHHSHASVSSSKQLKQQCGYLCYFRRHHLPKPRNLSSLTYYLHLPSSAAATTTIVSLTAIIKGNAMISKCVQVLLQKTSFTRTLTSFFLPCSLHFPSLQCCHIGSTASGSINVSSFTTSEVITNQNITLCLLPLPSSLALSTILVNERKPCERYARWFSGPSPLVRKVLSHWLFILKRAGHQSPTSLKPTNATFHEAICLDFYKSRAPITHKLKVLKFSQDQCTNCPNAHKVRQLSIPERGSGNNGSQ